MNRILIIAICVAFGSATPSFLSGQDSDLGILPPMPMLDLGDPERKLTWSERRRLAMIERRELAAQEAIARSEERAKQAEVGPRVTNNPFARQKVSSKPQKAGPLVNSISSADDALTASGNRLVPFGEEGDYWAGMPVDVGDQIPIELPPMPDLRTPDQVTSKERFRNRRVAKQENRNATSLAKKEEAERKRAATVSRPQADPNTALVIVESERPYAAPSSQNWEAPQTLNQGNLKPFDSNSVYIQNNQEVYRGDQKRGGGGLFGIFGRNKSE